MLPHTGGNKYNNALKFNNQLTPKIRYHIGELNPYESNSAKNKDHYLTYGDFKDVLSNLKPKLKQEKFDPSSVKYTDAYKKYGRKFDLKFGEKRMEISMLSKEFVDKSKRFSIFATELRNGNTNVNSFKKRVIIELEGIKSYMNEASNCIMSFINSKDEIKDYFCSLKVKKKNLKNNKIQLQDEIREYYYITFRRDMEYNKLINSFDEFKEQAKLTNNRLRGA